MEKGWTITLQSTMVMPYPSTKLYEEALETGWFKVDPSDYDCFDMAEPVLRTSDMEPEEVTRIYDEIYKIFLSPKYMFKHLIRIMSCRDVKYSVRWTMKVLGHMKDFA